MEIKVFGEETIQYFLKNLKVGENNLI